MKFVRTSDELATVPKTGGWLNGECISKECNGKNRPSDDIIEPSEIVHFLRLVNEYSLDGSKLGNLQDNQVEKKLKLS